jgi:hypothetical protein
MENEQRRSPRIMLSMAVIIRGVDEKGETFETTGRTVTLNRHGACIQVSCPLQPGQAVSVTNQTNGKDAEFRVIGPISPPLDDMGEWGVETVHLDDDIWDIDFPLSSEDSEAHILLACRQCQRLSLQSLSLVEVEVLETAGLLTKPCVHCGEPTPWGYPLRSFEMETETDQGTVSDATEDSLSSEVERRKVYRKAAQLPVRVRDYFGDVDYTQTENLTQDGFCFSSTRKYLVGQGIVVICPYDSTKEKPEVRARIVRVEGGSERELYFYGVHYEQAPH